MKRVTKAFHRLLQANSGQTAVIFGIAALPLLLGAGAAIDMSRVSRSRTALQAAVDAAALTVAKSSVDSQSGRQLVAKSAVEANLGRMKGSLNPTVTESEPVANRFEVSATASVATSVMKLMRLETVPISARAAAMSAPASSSRVCLFAKSATATPGLLANSGAAINAPNCEIHVASTGNPAATFNAATSLNVAKVCVAGTNVIKNSVTVPALTTGCAPASDPFASTLPTVSAGACTVTDQNYTGSITLNPGVYCGNFNFNGSGAITMNPGLYIFKNTRWNLNSSWSISGSGVTFYFSDDDSYVQFNSSVDANLTAPTSGTYKDILMFEAPGISDHSSFTVNGSANHVFKGLVYLPSRNVTFNSMSNMSADMMTIVVNTVILNTSSWNLQANAGKAITPVNTTGGPRLVD